MRTARSMTWILPYCGSFSICWKALPTPACLSIANTTPKPTCTGTAGLDLVINRCSHDLETFPHNGNPGRSRQSKCRPQDGQMATREQHIKKYRLLWELAQKNTERR